jgi:hypothetical protein
MGWRSSRACPSSAPRPFLDVVAGQLAVGGEVVGRELGDLAEHGPADLERVSWNSFFTPHVPACPEQRSIASTSVPGTARALRGLQPDLLHARVARHVVGDLAERRGKSVFSSPSRGAP